MNNYQCTRCKDHPGCLAGNDTVVDDVWPSIQLHDRKYPFRKRVYILGSVCRRLHDRHNPRYSDMLQKYRIHVDLLVYQPDIHNDPHALKQYIRRHDHKKSFHKVIYSFRRCKLCRKHSLCLLYIQL